LTTDKAAKNSNPWTQKRVFLSLGFALIALAVDQGSKIIALSVLPRHQHVDGIAGLIGWYLTFNDSAAFSISFGATWVFTLISTLATVALIWFLPRMKTVGWSLMAGVLLGGVVGNLVDRVSRAPGFPNGQVVDFIQIPFNFAIFNFADVCVTTVMSLVVIRIFLGDPVGGSVASKLEKTEATSRG
jgi:signal peptidase II